MLLQHLVNERSRTASFWKKDHGNISQIPQAYALAVFWRCASIHKDKHLLLEQRRQTYRGGLHGKGDDSQINPFPLQFVDDVLGGRDMHENVISRKLLA